LELFVRFEATRAARRTGGAKKRFGLILVLAFPDVRLLRQSGIEIPKPMLGFLIVIAVTANGQQSKPSRLDDAPSGLPPKLRLALAGRPTFQAPKRSLLLSIANDRLSKRILVRAPPSGFLLELMVAPWSLLLREQARSSSLLVWS